MTRDEKPKANLSLTLSFNTNSSVSGSCEAETVLHALVEYQSSLQQNLVRELKQLTEIAQQDASKVDFTDVAYDWHLLNQANWLIISIAEKAIELAESNYWASEALRSPSDYAHIVKAHQARKDDLVGEFLRKLDSEKEVSREK